MSRFDRYFLWQLLALFGFFALVLVGVLWVSRSLSLFDRLIRGGQSLVVFLEFSALILPSLLRTIAPIAAFLAALYATVRLKRESEATAMMAAGVGPFRLARAVLWFGLVVALMMGTLTLYLRPLSIAQLDLRETEIARDVTASFLVPGRFVHPTGGVTFFVGYVGSEGSLREVYISDRRDAESARTFTASEAYLVRAEDGVKFVMRDGMAMERDAGRDVLAVTRFQESVFDITEIVERASVSARDIEAVPTRELLYGRAALEKEGFGLGAPVAELHERISWPLICVAVALVGFSTLMLGGFSRFGPWPQVLVAFAMLIAIEGARSTMLQTLAANPGQWPLAYVPTAIAFAVSALFLQFAARPLRAFRLFRSPVAAVGPSSV